MPSPSINDALSVLPAKINLSRVEFTSSSLIGGPS